MVDPASTPLGRMLLDEITPVVMVLRTPLVEESCWKNGLNLVQLLSPFCVFDNIDVPVRTASDQPYRLKKFKLRLFYASDIRLPNIEAAEEQLKKVINQAGEDYYSALSSDPPDIETFLSPSKSEILPSWFEFFNKELVHSVSFSEHEAFDHPVACLLVVSSRDEEPVNKFVDLFNTNQLPSLLNDGAMDPKILKHFLLVHDNQDGNSEKATKILTEMRGTFGTNDCRLLCINSSDDETVKHQENLWASFKANPSDGQQIGCFLNLDDLHELKSLMHDLSSKQIIPHMEQKIRILNQQVSATRRGLKNQIKNLWWRKGKEDVLDNPNGSMYTFSSTESQIRVLGDYAFMLRDYELAMSNYRLLSTDYKLDKAWKQYAGVQEMMGLTYFMLDQSRKDAEYSMESAFTTYLKIGSSGQRNATRCGLWWVEILKARDQYKEAASVYFRISGEEPLHSAVMLEQGSYCYLFSQPPMLRKYGFHLILSGDLYKKCDQIKHAIRAYRNALSVFRGTNWNHISDHVHFHIGKWYAFLGMFDVAVKHMLEVLACGHQSKKTQELFLRDFFQIIQKTGKLHEVLSLQLPKIDVPSIKVTYEDHRTYASPSAFNARESLWQSLEDDMIPSISTIRTNWLESQPKHISRTFKESNVCVAGEAIKVDIGFRNPLQIPISVSSVSLICEHSARSNETELEASTSTTELVNDREFKSDASGDIFSDTPPFMLSEVDIFLSGGETLMAQLSVTPKLEGMLKIVGVRWKLSDSIVGFNKFETDLMRKKVAKGKHKAMQSASNGLTFMVIKSLPKLEGFIRDLPKTVYAGDLRLLTLELNNASEIPVKNLKMKISHPRFLTIGNEKAMTMDFPSFLRKKTNSLPSCQHTESNKVSDTSFMFPEEMKIHGNGPILWPLWFRAADSGSISLYITIYYEMGDVSTVMSYRTLRMHYVFEVLPSLDVSFQISPCPSRVPEFIVRMDIVNKTSSESFRVHQLSTIGNQWAISLFQSLDTIFPMEFLMAGQAFSFFFKLKNCTNQTTKSDVSFNSSLERTDVTWYRGDDEAVFDIYSSPLVDFHHHERVNQENSDQGHQNMVDFILISSLKSDDNPGVNSSPIFFSHHACHCSVASPSPIWWLMEGPRMIQHNFLASFCDVKLRMTIHNISNAIITVRINTIDTTSGSGPLSNASTGNDGGWHDVSLSSDFKVASDSHGAQLEKSFSTESVSPFMWAGSSSTRVKIKPISTTEVPLQICVFSPGTYDLSNYILQWDLSSDYQNDDKIGTRPSSGTCQGHPYYLTVLQHDRALLSSMRHD